VFVITFKIVRGLCTASVAIDALIIDEVLARNVVGPFLGLVSHGLFFTFSLHKVNPERAIISR